MLPPLLRRHLARLRRTTCETMGWARYSWPALHGLDRKLDRHLDIDGGWFVEAGANDGVAQSNTYHFEKLRGWRGLLIEPVPALAAECRKNRRGPVVEAALVAAAEPGATVELHFAGLMSTLAGALGDAAATTRHVQAGLAVQGLARTYVLRVPARTLTDILAETRPPRAIDLLSLDVEGGEPAALRGLDLDRYAPRFICVESRDRPAIEAELGSRYRLVEILADLGPRQDLLYALR